MSQQPYPPSISLHFSDFDFDVATLETDGYGENDGHRSLQLVACSGGNDSFQQWSQADEILGRSLRPLSASPRLSDFDFDAALIRSDDGIDSKHHATSNGTSNSELNLSHARGDGPDAGTLRLDPAYQLTTDTAWHPKDPPVGYTSDTFLESDDYDEISLEAQVVPDQECAHSMLEDMLFDVDDIGFQRGGEIGLEFWVGDKLSESSDWLAFERVSDVPEYQDSGEKRDDLLHSSDWAMLEDKLEDRDGDAGSTVPSDDYLHSSDWAILADDFSQGQFECSQRGAAQPKLVFRQDQGLTRGQTDCFAPERPENVLAASPCRSFMTTSPQPREWVLEKLEMMACQVLEDLTHGRTPEIELSSRTRAEAIVYDDENGVVRRAQDRSPFDEMARLPSNPVQAANKGVHKETVASKRDLFYRDVNLFRSQPVVDKMVEDMACTLRVPRSNLNVMAGGRSILFGSLRVTIKTVADADDPCMLPPESTQSTEDDSLYSDYMRTDYNTPVTLPGLMDDIVHLEIHPKTLFVLVIEKESTFLHLARSGFCNTHGPCILLTSKGYPDFVARQLLKHLERMVQDGTHTMSLPYNTPTSEMIPDLGSYSADSHQPDRQVTLKIPLLALVDCDPHGFKIFLTYRCGSVECAYDNANLAVPSLECLGQFPSDWDHILKGERTLLQERLERQLIPLLPRDRSALVKLLTRHPFIRRSREWQVRISRMLMMNRKSEIQSLDLGEVESEAVVAGEGAMGGLGHYLRTKLQSCGV
ncbi:endodeoxyribonuclease [Mortierella alpina]|uniref:DNA topoisomerase (ATP-hydrolyzing) n=1 Tax=Mortierella alpina TaxID=64518 RepID=A0A9P6J431_MORAP|nr:endodeoxyribonuclease [Mortierella alpina]